MKKRREFSNFGFSTILLTFSMICIVTFSALAFVTANSDYKLSKRVADNNSSYYVKMYGMRYHRLMPFLHPPTRAILIKQHTMRP